MSLSSSRLKGVGLHDMWGPRLKYYLEVWVRSPDDVAIVAPGSFRG
jgi:hypothetical protein